MVYIVILAILTGMFIGFRRGFLRSVFKLLITILSVVLSYVLAPLIANWVISYTTLDDKLQASIASQMEETARQQVKNQLEASVGQYGITVTDDMVNAALDTQLSENQQADMLYQISMPEDARETILQNASANVADYAARSFYQYPSRCSGIPLRRTPTTIPSGSAVRSPAARTPWCAAASAPSRGRRWRIWR